MNNVLKYIHDDLKTEIRNKSDNSFLDYLVHEKRYVTELEFCQKIIDRQKGLKVLEIGVDRGYIGRYLVNECDYHGLDITLDNIMYNDVKEKSLQFNLDTLTDDCHLPYNNEEFDLIIMSEVFEHLHPYKVKAVMCELKRVLNGPIFFSTPNLSAIENRIALLFGGIKGYRNGSTTHPVHAREYSYKELESFFLSMDFKIDDLFFENARAFLTLDKNGLPVDIPVTIGIFKYFTSKNLFRLFTLVLKLLNNRFSETVYIILKK